MIFHVHFFKVKQVHAPYFFPNFLGPNIWTTEANMVFYSDENVSSSVQQIIVP